MGSPRVTDENIKKASLVSALQARVLMWYIKYSSDYSNAGIKMIQDALNTTFNWPKLETQSIIWFKEIVMLPGETSWDLDKRKNTIDEANMTLIDA